MPPRINEDVAVVKQENEEPFSERTAELYYNLTMELKTQLERLQTIQQDLYEMLHCGK